MVAASAPESSRRWTPDGNDHLIFQWVKLKGHSQDWVATQLGISQSTVSRVVQRYERWQAHAKEREGGRLDHAERLRAQRWLTFERNEALLASCLRIANEMEGFTDVSKSTIRRGQSLTDEREVCTQHSTIDRSGIAARFLRLAFRINMEQLKLAELDPPPAPQPLTEDQLAAELQDAAADAAEICRLLRSAPKPAADADQGRVHEPSEMHHRADDEPELERDLSDAEPGSQAPPWEPDAPSLPPRPRVSEGEDPGNGVHPVHILHNDDQPQIAATASAPCSCTPQPAAEKISPTCITAPEASPPLVIRVTPDNPFPFDSSHVNAAQPDHREAESPDKRLVTGAT